MDKHTSEALNLASSQIAMAAEALICLRWAIDRTLMNEDLDGFIAIARIVLPTARGAMEAIESSIAGDHVRSALDAIAFIERETDGTMPAADFDRITAISDPSIERATVALQSAQEACRAPLGVVSSNCESSRDHTVEDSSWEVV